MKLSDVRPNIETSGQLEEQFFSVQDQGMIFDILRNKMYSNPILAICREISCNARDAHREIGKSEIPIHVYLPNSFEPFFKIKDFGPGISPDRMSNVFIKYTASTKRNDNIQTGGFGLGAKTPFSYSDTFTIKTNIDGIQYNYACFIDETRVGKLILMGQEPTDDPNGTEIIIPVKNQDFKVFAECIENATRHWDIKPVFSGGTIIYPDKKHLISGNNWKVTSSDNYNRFVKLIIDGIEYPLETSFLNKNHKQLIESIPGNIYLYFKVGEITLSASREQIYLDKETQNKISDLFEIVKNEIKDEVTKTVNSFSNLYDANVYYRKLLRGSFSNLDFLGKVSWKNIFIENKNYIHLGCTIYKFSKGKYSHKKGMNTNKIYRSSSQELYFDPDNNTKLVLNDSDLKDPTPKHVKPLFDTDDKIKNVIVICPNSIVTKAILDSKFNLDQMAPILLSTITKATGRKYTPPTSRLLVFKFNITSGNFSHVSYNSVEEDTNKKIICRLVKNDYNNTRQVILSDERNLSLSGIYALAKEYPNYSIYGIDELIFDQRVKEDFEDFILIEDFINKFVLPNSSINFIKLKLANKYCVRIPDFIRNNFKSIKSKISNQNSLYLKKLELDLQYSSLENNDHSYILYIYELLKGSISDSDIDDWLVKNPDFDYEKIREDYNIKYPLLTHIYSHYDSKLMDYIIHYVNLVDKI